MICLMRFLVNFSAHMSPVCLVARQTDGMQTHWVFIEQTRKEAMWECEDSSDAHRAPLQGGGVLRGGTAKGVVCIIQRSSGGSRRR